MSETNSGLSYGIEVRYSRSATHQIPIRDLSQSLIEAKRRYVANLLLQRGQLDAYEQYTDDYDPRFEKGIGFRVDLPKIGDQVVSIVTPPSVLRFRFSGVVDPDEAFQVVRNLDL